MTAMVLHQSYMTQQPSVYTIQLHATVFSFTQCSLLAGLPSVRRLFVALLRVGWVIWNNKPLQCFWTILLRSK